MDYGGEDPKMADQGCVWLCGGAGLYCTLWAVHPLWIWNKGTVEAVACDLWCYISVICLCLWVQSGYMTLWHGSTSAKT